MADRQLLISHPIGAAGRFQLSTASGTVRIEGTDGELAEVLARYRAPSGVELTSDPTLDGVLDIVREDGELRVAVRDPGGSGVLASLTRLVGQYRPDVDFQVRLPRGATVRLDAFSGDAAILGLCGDQDLHTVSGDLELHGSGGRIRVTTVSGDASIRGDVVSIMATTTSGDVAVDAELVQQLSARAVSGDVSIRAALGRDTVHTFESVSGDLQLATPSGLAIELTGVSGSVRSQVPSRREQRDGKRLTLIGDGGVSLRARTISGDVIVAGPGGKTRRLREDDPFGFGPDVAAFGAGFPNRPPSPPRPPTPPMPARPATPPPPRPVAPTVVPLPGPRSTATSAAPAPETHQLAILRLLESGQIDVDEAARRLEALS